MKFNIYFTIRGPGGTQEASNTGNPVECANLASLLNILKDNLPRGPHLGLETIGLRIEEAPPCHQS